MGVTAYARASTVDKVKSGLPIFLALAVSCSGPTGPTCDPLGRGPVASLFQACFAVGTNLQCQATRQESSYCAGPARDVTTSAVWTTSDPSVGVFNSPGQMTTIGTGLVEINATYENLKTDPIAFTVAPIGTPERMLELSVIAFDESGRRVPGVDVQIAADRGAGQACQTNATGSCGGWVFDTPIRVTGTKAGFVPAQATAYDPYQVSLFRRADLIMRSR